MTDELTTPNGEPVLSILTRQQRKRGESPPRPMIRSKKQRRERTVDAFEAMQQRRKGRHDPYDELDLSHFGEDDEL